jgi:transketolase
MTRCLLLVEGFTLHEAISAANELSKAGVGVRVLDLFTVKPIDKEGIIKNANECGGRILVVEEHYYEGGIGEAVCAAVSQERNIIVKHIAVPRVPRSGTPTALLDYYGLNSKHIVNYVQEILKL